MHEAKISRAFASVPLGIILADQTGVVLDANLAATNYLNIPLKIIVGKKLKQFFPFELKSNTSISDRGGDQEQNCFILESPKEDESSKYLEVMRTEWHGESGAKYFTLMFNDISEQQIARLSIQKTLERWDYALAGADIGVFEVDLRTGKSVVSATWRRLMEIDDADVTDPQEVWLSRIHPEDFSAVKASDLECIKGRTERTLTTYRMRSVDGKQWRWMCSDATVVSRDETGQAVRLIGAQTDITEKIELENSLKISVEQFRSAFKNAPIGKAIVDLQGRWVQVNTSLCDLLGFTETELKKTDFQSLTHPDDLQTSLHQIDLLISGKITSFQNDQRYVKSDRDIIWGQLSVGLVKNSRGEPDHLIVQIVDVTEQRQLVELKSEFVATVSHELRTPLTSILGSLSLLSLTEAENFSDEAHRLLFIAQRNGDRLKHLVNDILEFEKFSAGKMQVLTERKPIASLVDQAVLSNLGFADKFNVHIDTVCPNRGLWALVDAKRFHQVMANLLSNAAKFSDEGSTIKILVKELEDAVGIFVVNQGDEIPANFRDQVFEPFSG